MSTNQEKRHKLHLVKNSVVALTGKYLPDQTLGMPVSLAIVRFSATNGACHIVTPLVVDIYPCQTLPKLGSTNWQNVARMYGNAK
jgi:hypothetical protein